MASEVQARGEFDAAYPHLVTAVEGAIRRFFRYDDTQVEDAVAETMARTYADWARVRRSDDLIAAALAHAKNVCVERVRLDALRAQQTAAQLAGINVHIELADVTMLSASIPRSLDRLSKRQRDVAVLHFLMECDEQVTAAALNMSVANVRAAAQEARDRCGLFLYDVVRI